MNVRTYSLCNREQQSELTMTDGTVINERRAVSTFNCIQKRNRVDLNQPLIYEYWKAIYNDINVH